MFKHVSIFPTRNITHKENLFIIPRIIVIIINMMCRLHGFPLAIYS